MIFRDFEHWCSEIQAHGWSSAGREYAQAIWDELEPTIKASRDDYKKAYIKLMNEQAFNNVELVNALLEYIEEYKRPNQPKFWRWWFNKTNVTK